MEKQSASTKAAAEKFVKVMMDNHKAQAEERRQWFIKARICGECREPLVGENLITNPETGESKPSAYCPPCRKIRWERLKAQVAEYKQKKALENGIHTPPVPEDAASPIAAPETSPSE